jgi:tripartite-type tricarboxylate transporter receptor subunit TctC
MLTQSGGNPGGSIMAVRLSLTVKRALAVLFSVCFLVGCLVPIHAQDKYPSRAIRVLIPYPAGGIVDVAARIVTNEVSKILGQPIVVEDKPGANTNLATGLAARAEPDGYTWTYVGPATLVNPRIYSNLPWTENSFVGVGLMARAPFAIVVNPSCPANSLDELVKLAKKSPGSLSYGNPGLASASNLNAVMFMLRTKINMNMVAYRGQPSALMDIISNRINVMFATVGLVSGFAKANKLKVLAVVSQRRVPNLPKVPTLSEEGYADINVVPWWGLAVPKGTPQPIVQKINAAINLALQKPEVKALMAKQLLEPATPMLPGQIASLIAHDRHKLGRIVDEAHIRISQ